MSSGLHFSTLVWGVVLTLAGAALAAVGFGWWDLSAVNLGFIGPAFVILLGIVILVGALLPGRHERSRIETK